MGISIVWLKKQLDKINKEIDMIDNEIENINPSHLKQMGSVIGEKRTLKNRARQIRKMIIKQKSLKIEV